METDLDNKIFFFDTTLRDGQQTTGVDFTVENKIKFSHALNEIGIDYIEGGWPGSNPTDDAFFNMPQNFSKSKLVAFGMTRRPSTSVQNDPGLNTLINTNLKNICIVGKSSSYQVEKALEISKEDNLKMISDSIAHLVSKKIEAMYDAEHFFDGYKIDPEYALQCLQVALKAGARWIVLCDTNGGTLPNEVYDIVKEVAKHIPSKNLGIHAHNDTENAVANSLAAVEAGARQVQGTINGLGERCGNANLVSVIPNIILKTKYDCNIKEDNLVLLKKTSLLLNDLLNRQPNSHQAYVGENAFAHKGGLHVSAINKDPKTYEHIDPKIVGNKRKIVVSDQSGKSNIISMLNTVGISPEEHKNKLDHLLQEVKNKEYQGHSFDEALASFEILARKTLFGIPDFFELIRFKVIDDRRWNARGELVTESEATVRIKVKDQEFMNVEIGNGPVNALDKALRKTLVNFYPSLQKLELTDFKVRILSSEKGTDAIVRVIIETKDEDSQIWTTVGVSTNIIDASYNALREGLIYKLIKSN
ncbi:MAG: citramalate synthase [Pelagibacteraceae bacterium]|nr:citramalate synthase [Pelagibacteraceae bacterium]